MEYVKPDINTHTYVLGIDFGHGETSADICKIQWNDGYMQMGKPESVEILKNQNAIISALLIEENEDGVVYSIGSQAVSRYSNPKYHNGKTKLSYYAYFKKVPSLMSNEERNVMRIFMKEVYQQIRIQCSDLTDTNHIVYIACPSNPKLWNDEELSNYAEIALEAGIPIAKIDDKYIGIIRESRAAFIKVRSDLKEKSGVKEGLLLIDFGSSTVDLTYYSSKCTDKPIDDGYNCGASNVESLITQDFAAQNGKVAESIRRVTTADTAITMTIRLAKEAFYSENSEDMEVVVNLTKITDGLIRGSEEKYYSQDEINTILYSYKESIRKAFIDYRDKYLTNKPIELIFMTGGASRMDFVLDIAREVFHYKKNFYRAINPSLTISNGIALAGRADCRTFAMEKDLLKSNILKADFATKIIDNVSSTIANDVISKTSTCFSNFASRSYDDSINSLASDIKKSINGMDYGSYLNRSYNEELKDISNSTIIPKVNGIVKSYYPDFAIPKISSSTTFTLIGKAEEIGAIEDMIGKSFDEITEGFFEGLGKVVFNIVAGALSGAVAIIIDLGIGIKNFFANFFGIGDKTDPIDVIDVMDDCTMDFRKKSTKLSSSRRNDVKVKFEKEKDNYRTQIVRDIKNKFNESASLVDTINQKGAEDIKNYITNQIQNARIMLN